MNIYDFFIQLSCLVLKCQQINKNRKDGRFLFIRRRFVTKRLSQWKKIINIHYQCWLPDPTPSATSHKINFQFSDFDTYSTILSSQDKWNFFPTSKYTRPSLKCGGWSGNFSCSFNFSWSWNCSTLKRKYIFHICNIPTPSDTNLVKKIKSRIT